MSEGLTSNLGIIIAMLTTRTLEGGVKWEWERQWDGGKGRCVAELTNGRVLVGKDIGNDTFITIQDSDLNTLEAVNVGFPEYLGLRSTADELYELARRSALQVDSKLESILGEIMG